VIPSEKLEAAAMAVQFGVSPEVQRQGILLVSTWRRQQDCLRWIANQAIGVRGGWSCWEVQQIAGAAARGGDWQATRESLLEKRTMQRRQLPRASPSPSGNTR
jgi:hypothetical protein